MSGLLLARRSCGGKHVAAPTTVTASTAALGYVSGSTFTYPTTAAAIGNVGNTANVFFLISPAVPQGATISSATLTLKQNSHNGTATALLANCYGEAIDNATAPTTAAGYNAGVRTTAVKAFTGTTDAANIAIDATAIVQEIVNRSGWASGHAMLIYLQDNGSPLITTISVSSTTFPSISVTYT